MSDTRNHTTRDQLAKVVADAICRDRPKYSPDQACRAHLMQAEYAADALLASDAIAAVRAAAVAETTAAIEATLDRLAVTLGGIVATKYQTEIRAALSGGRTALDTMLADAWDEGWGAAWSPMSMHNRDNGPNPYRADTGADQ